MHDKYPRGRGMATTIPSGTTFPLRTSAALINPRREAGEDVREVGGGDRTWMLSVLDFRISVFTVICGHYTAIPQSAECGRASLLLSVIGDCQLITANYQLITGSLTDAT